MIEDMGQFTDQVVVVTGATGGLGGAVVHAFLSEGATVWGILGPSSPSRIADPKFATVAADLTVPAEAELAVRKVIETSGKIDVLLHLTGGFAGGKPLAETDDADWNSMLGLNLHTAIHMARAVLPHMLETGKGRIVAIGSRTGVEPAAGSQRLWGLQSRADRAHPHHRRRSAQLGDYGQHRTAQRDRHAGQPRRQPRSRLL